MQAIPQQQQDWLNSLTQYFEQSPGVAVCLLVGGLILGLLLWMLGRRMARTACAICGLLVASGAAVLMSASLTSPTMQLATIIGGGMVGCLIAFMLFRFWMGLACCIVFAIVLPTVYLAWQDPAPGSPAPPPGVAPSHPVPNATEPNLEKSTPDDMSVQNIGLAPADEYETLLQQCKPTTVDSLGLHPTFILSLQATATAVGLIHLQATQDNPSALRQKVQEQLVQLGQDMQKTVGMQLREQLSQWQQQQWSSLRGQWSNLTSDHQRMAVIYAGIGALIGMMLGLLFPYTAAMFQSTIVGSLLLGLCAYQLLLINTSTLPTWLPESTRSKLIALGLMTAIGCVFQLGVFKRKAT